VCSCSPLRLEIDGRILYEDMFANVYVPRMRSANAMNDEKGSRKWMDEVEVVDMSFEILYHHALGVT